jgi:proteasome lid subunit RPN8/RPN11
MEVRPQIAGQVQLDVDPAQLPEMTLPDGITGERKACFQSLVRQSAIRNIEAHGKASMGAEVCGVLVGDIYRDASGPLLYIRAIIRGDPATGNVSQVTFTSQTWSHIHEQLEQNFPDEKIVGWYHTHPGHGIFLSGMDLFIHENFFNLPWQIAMVYDPHSHEHGLFVWKDQKTVRDEFLIENDPIDETEITAEEAANVPGKMKQRLRSLFGFAISMGARLRGKRRADPPTPWEEVGHE